MNPFIEKPGEACSGETCGAGVPRAEARV